MRLLEAILLPKSIACIHCRGHQKGEAEIIRGNNRADMAAKQVAEGGDRLQTSLLLVPPDPNSYTPIYTPEEGEKPLRWGYFKSPEGLLWWRSG